MVIIFHISISLFNFTFELSTEFKWGITARQRTNMPYIESFSRTFDQNGDTLSYLKGTGSRRRTPPRHILVFWPFFLSEFRCLFLFPANVEMLRCCWNVQGPSVFLTGSKVPSPHNSPHNYHLEIRHNSP